MKIRDIGPIILFVLIVTLISTCGIKCDQLVEKRKDSVQQKYYKNVGFYELRTIRESVNYYRIDRANYEDIKKIALIRYKEALLAVDTLKLLNRK